MYTVSTYSFVSHSGTTEIRVLDIATGQSRLITNEEGTSSPNWLVGRDILWLRTDKNSTKLVVGNADDVGNSYDAATVPAEVSDIKVKRLGDKKVAIALVAKAKPDGSLFSPQEEATPRSTARLYDNTFVRHWDTYVAPNKNAIWHAILEQKSREYAMGELTNILKGSKLESPIPTFGGLDNFDLASTGICFVAKDPDLNPAFNTRSNFYYVSIKYGSNSLEYSRPVKSQVKNYEGASTSPAFSPDGESAVYLQMRENGYESDKNHLFIVDVEDPDEALELMPTDGGEGLWDRNPQSVSFGSESLTLLLTAEDEGKVKLYKLALPGNPRPSTNLPEALTSQGQVTGYHVLGEKTSKVLLSSTSFVDGSYYSTVDIGGSTPRHHIVSSSSQNGSLFHLSWEQISEIWFDGQEDYKVHAWVITPSAFDPEEQYPLAYIIHGGPQGSWEDGWSTRWYALGISMTGPQ